MLLLFNGYREKELAEISGNWLAELVNFILNILIFPTPHSCIWLPKAWIEYACNASVDFFLFLTFIYSLLHAVCVVLCSELFLLFLGFCKLSSGQP